MEGIHCSDFIFYNDFDSANLARVEHVPPNESVISKQTGGKGIIPELPDAEFNIWTKPDCYGTEFENGNRTWFYFGMKANEPSLLIRFNLVDLNRQGKMYSQGMAPVYRVIPGKPQWERIRDRPSYTIQDNIFTLTFKFRTPENIQSIMYFAFTYPFTYVDLERLLLPIDRRFLSTQPLSEDDIYYTRECVCKSLDGRNIDLITISSYHGITDEREPRLKNLFPDTSVPRCFKFVGKKVIFVSARVHPGETPSSFVFNGFLNQLLLRDDLVAINLRKLYVFKLIPFLNPDGVARGHYRTDTRGVNLNRVYMNPKFSEHPSVYAARSLIRYYHFGAEKDDVLVTCDSCADENELDKKCKKPDENISRKVSHMTLGEGDTNSYLFCSSCKNNIKKLENNMPGISNIIPTLNVSNSLGFNYCRQCGSKLEIDETQAMRTGSHGDTQESNLFLYLDMHGHASKKGIFMYGNYFEDIDKSVECMLLPKLMSMNNHNFHFNSCNFTERNMFLKDKRDGMSRAGSGRVSVLSLTGLIRSYTLECNYNTGRLVNVLPPTLRESSNKVHTLPMPPKYTPLIFEEVGKSLCTSILDLTGNNPLSRLSNSEFRSLSGLREWLTIQCEQDLLEPRCKSAKTKKLNSLQNQGKTTRGVTKSRLPLTKASSKKINNRPRTMSLPVERKENLGISQPSTSKSVLKLNKFGFKSKSRKDISLKTKNNAAAEKFKTVRGKQKNIKLQNANEEEKEDMKIREICFINNNEGKTVIAKYKKSADQESEENLVVTWGHSSTSAQIYTHKGKISTSVFKSGDPGTSKQGIRVHNFTKTPSFHKNKKITLRRLANASDPLSKVEKKKKKKIKSKN